MRMSSLTYGRVSQLEAVDGLLTLFAYAEQCWCTWEKLENSLTQSHYDNLSDEELEWFIEFMANIVLRIWRSSKEDTKLNRVEQVEEGFIIHNYDWDSFKFGKEHQVDKDLITASMYTLDKDNLSGPEIKALRRKCK